MHLYAEAATTVNESCCSMHLHLALYNGIWIVTGVPANGIQPNSAVVTSACNLAGPGLGLAIIADSGLETEEEGSHISTVTFCYDLLKLMCACSNIPTTSNDMSCTCHTTVHLEWSCAMV